MDNEYLETTLDERGVLTVRLNRPRVENALNGGMVHELLHLLESTADAPDVRVMVLRGNGPVFSTGSDVEWVREMASAGYDINLRDAKTLVTMFDTLDAYPKPVICAVHGAVKGEAVGLVAASDVVVASAETEFRLPETDHGLVPACVAPYLIAKIGPSNARHLLLTGRAADAERARALQLIHEIVSTPERLDGAVKTLTEAALRGSPDAYNLTKKLMRRLTFRGHSRFTMDTLEDVAMCQAQSRASRDAREGLDALRENRAPEWTRHAQRPARS